MINFLNKIIINFKYRACICIDNYIYLDLIFFFFFNVMSNISFATLF